MAEIRVELLIGRTVVDRDGTRVGRLEELRAEDGDDAARVTTFLVGAYAVFERLAGYRIGRAVAAAIGRGKLKSYAIPWRNVDLRDPDHPRLTCPKSELREYEVHPARRKRR